MVALEILQNLLNHIINNLHLASSGTVFHGPINYQRFRGNDFSLLVRNDSQAGLNQNAPLAWQSDNSGTKYPRFALLIGDVRVDIVDSSDQIDRMALSAQNCDKVSTSMRQSVIGECCNRSNRIDSLSWVLQWFIWQQLTKALMGLC